MDGHRSFGIICARGTGNPQQDIADIPWRTGGILTHKNEDYYVGIQRSR